jgi:outer membrane protein
MMLSRLQARIFIASTLVFLLQSVSILFAQKVGFVATQTIRDRFYEYKTAQTRIEEISSGWKREMDEMHTSITTIEQDIQKKRLIWTDAELREKDSLLMKKRRDREEFIRRKFNAGGEFDTVATNYLRPVEAKITAAVQDVAASEGYDIVLDKASSPLMVSNPRYDLTVKVMEKLSIFADDLKAKQKEAIEKDAQNKKDAKGNTPSRRRPPMPTSSQQQPQPADEKK